MAYIIGDDTKWQEALADGNANPGFATEPMELVLTRFERSGEEIEKIATATDETMR